MEQKTEQEQQNYERMLFAIAVLFANQLHLNTYLQDEYSKLTPAQKTFAKKIYGKDKGIRKLVETDKRISEQQIVEKVADIQSIGDVKRVVTVGDQSTCPACKKWQGKLLSLSGAYPGLPTLQDFINSDGLHYGCRCALQDVDTKEITRKHVYNCMSSAKPAVVVFG